MTSSKSGIKKQNNTLFYRWQYLSTRRTKQYNVFAMIKSVAENSILKIVAIAFDASKVEIFANLLPSSRTNPFGKVNISLEFPSIFSQTFGTHFHWKYYKEDYYEEKKYEKHSILLGNFQQIDSRVFLFSSSCRKSRGMFNLTWFLFE